MISTTVTKTVEFPYEEWHVLRSPTGEIAQIRPVKGTWTLLSGEDRHRMAAKGVNIKGVISCPQCQAASFLPETFDPPKELGDGKPPCEYRCNRCRLICYIVLKDWDRRKLYCACYETRDGDSLKAHKEYLHAVDETEARKLFWASHGPEVSNLVAIAPAVGFFVADKVGQQLIA